MADNWYVVLELDFDPPVEDETKIAERIEEKVKFWSSKTNDFKMGPHYRLCLQNAPQMKKDMIGPGNIRKKLAEEACAAVYGPLDKMLKTIGKKGNINNMEGEKLSASLKLPLDVVKKRAKHLGIPWVAGEAIDHQAIYDKYYKTKPQNAQVFDNMKDMLSAFGVKNLYEFLYADTPTKNAGSLPCATLLQRSAEKKKTFRKNDSISGTGSKLCGQCELAFGDESAKAIYDSYLEYAERKAILDHVKAVASISDGELTADSASEPIGQLTQILRDRKLSENILISFCKIEKILYNPHASQKKTSDIRVCRCGIMNDVSDGRKVCSSCGLPLFIRCPSCGTENDASIRVCRCGFHLDNIDKAIALCQLAEHAMEALEFRVAKAHLNDADRYWPKSKTVSDLRARLLEYEGRVGAEVATMRRAMENKCYLEAQRQYGEIKKLFPGYNDPDVEEEITQAISQAKAVYQQACRAGKEAEVLELCAKAFALCADLNGIKELMGKYPPSPVTGFSVSPNPGIKGNVISWTANPGDKSLRYIIVRSKSGWVRNHADGEEIFKGSASSFCDKNIQPGAVYYYNVFTERAGIVSKGAEGSFKEIVNLFEVSSAAVAAGNASLNITWDPLPQNAAAEIYQVSPSGSEKHIATSTSDSYLVSGLTNDTRYLFRVALSYAVGSGKRETKGVSLSGIPTSPPMPVDTLRIKPGQDDIFEATWYYSEPGEIRLFSSVQKPRHNIGDIIPLAALEREMKQLQQLPLTGSSAQKLQRNEHGSTFRYSGSQLLYVTAVAVKSGSAVFGSVARANKGEAIRIREIRPVNGKINIFLDPPGDATGFVVLHRFDQFPADLSDTNTVRKYIPIKQYQLYNAIVLDFLEPKKYYFSVFAEFRHDGEKDYSSGSDYIFDNSSKVTITYSISVSKKILGFLGDNAVTLEFEADTENFTLPDIDIMSAVGNTPMFKSSAKLFHSIPAQTADRKVQVRIPIPDATPKDTYIKAFFRDDAAQAGNQLRLNVNSKYKIT